MTADTPLLEVENLSVAYGDRTVLHDITLSLRPDEVLGIVGETGAGKSVLARAMLDLLPGGGRVTGGRIRVGGRDLATLPEPERRALRGGTVALIGTDAKSLLDPVRTVGAQVADVLRAHRRLGAAEAKAQAIELFAKVGIVDPEKRAEASPHQLSGGMAQRVVIAMALIAEPSVILADDATLGLDATIQVQVLDLLVARCRELGMGAVIITHDLGIVARYCDRVEIMRDGRIVEEAPTARFLSAPATPYGAELLGAARARPAPMARAAAKGATERPLVEVVNLVKHFTTGSGHVVRAVDDVSFAIPAGETLALVGESGSGKTTVGQCLARLLDSDGGAVLFRDRDMLGLPEKAFRPLRRDIQMVFQEPYVALNPRWTVERLVGEPLGLDPEMAGAEARRARVREMLELTRLPARLAEAYPHELTAGEQKRVGMARALATRPAFVVFDEPTTALDIRVRAQIIDLVRELQREMRLSTLFITHDLNSVRSLAHSVAVMRHGRIVEMGETERIFAAPSHDYTRMLLGAELPIERYTAA
ncbi:ATP-binding cassette domain-containing protein [Amaricoccus solimangrovi]|uniref:ABC transporter ATP-binding protein n=1 Tax=Amaricoccus solimangrovi TaxID=2589815 RepID=A0A501WLK7_9RHOB|nr:ABC transporter ATP-binding protein [Amaricoccus solimangrovi]TPE49290.1 ABC transporter ATP-binding protein [Amaricoccus solimangrovi]